MWLAHFRDQMAMYFNIGAFRERASEKNQSADSFQTDLSCLQTLLCYVQQSFIITT